jgi:hypothetical protein
MKSYLEKNNLHKMSKIDMICFAKPVLTEDVYIVHKEGFSVTWLYVRYVPLTKAKPVHKRQTHLVRMLHKDYARKGSVAKIKSQVSRGLGPKRTD